MKNTLTLDKFNQMIKTVDKIKDNNILFGLKLIESEYMVDKIQRKKHKKKRINKKWRKKYGFIAIPKKDFYQFGNNIIAHPVMIYELRKHLKS